jgi:hypothetical protein
VRRRARLGTVGRTELLVGRSPPVKLLSPDLVSLCQALTYGATIHPHREPV